MGAQLALGAVCQPRDVEGCPLGAPSSSGSAACSVDWGWV